MVPLNIILSLFLGLPTWRFPRWLQEMLYAFLSTLQDHHRLLHFTILTIQSNYFIAFCRLAYRINTADSSDRPQRWKMITGICQIKYGPCTGTVQITQLLCTSCFLLKRLSSEHCTFLSPTGITSCTHQTWPAVRGLSRQSSPAKQWPLAVADVPLAVYDTCLCLQLKHVTLTLPSSS